MHNLLKLTPNIPTVTCTEEDGSKLLGSMLQGNKKCMKLVGFMIRDDEKLGLAKRIVKCCPNLEELWLTDLLAEVNYCLFSGSSSSRIVTLHTGSQPCAKVLGALRPLHLIHIQVAAALAPPRTPS